MPNDPRPNIVLITADSLRADALGAYGNTFVRTPHLDALARRGVVFDNAHIQAVACIASRACLHTGRYGHQHGLQLAPPAPEDTEDLRPWELTFMERLQRAGYRTAAFGVTGMHPPRGFHEMLVTGGKGARWTKSAGLRIGLGPLGRDYAAWLEERHPGAYEAIHAQRRLPEYRRFRTALPSVVPLEEYIDYWTPQNAIDFIRRPHDAPFFIECGFCAPHSPLDPPAPYDSLYPMDEVPLPPNYGIDGDGNPRVTTPEHDAVARRFCAYYYGLVTLVDDMVGSIISALEETGLMPNTLFVFTVDHGEMLFERGFTGKSRFWEPILKAPLIVVPPAAEEIGRRVEGLVEQFDVAPTILDYARAEIPPSMSASSLRALVEGGTQGKGLVFSETVEAGSLVRGACLRTRRFKYVYWTHEGKERFCDLEEDPLERRNLIADPGFRDEIAHHRMLMIQRIMQTPH